MNKIFESIELDIINSPASLFSKEDVLKIVNTIHFQLGQLPANQPTSDINILASDFANFTSKVREKLSYYLESSDIVDYDSANFEIEYNNQLVLNHVHVDLDSWTEEFDEYMLDNFTEIFGDDSIIADK